MLIKKANLSKRSEDAQRSASKVVDPKRDTPTRAKHLRLLIDNSDLHEVVPFFEKYYSHIFYVVYDAFVAAEANLKQKGAHKAQREELESVLYLFEKILLYLPEHLSRKWQYHSVSRLMCKLLHRGNNWRLLKREAMRLFLLWYQVLGAAAGDHVHAMFATLVPGFPSPTHWRLEDAGGKIKADEEPPISPEEITPLVPAPTGEKLRSADTDLTQIFLDVLLELVVTQVPLVEWKQNKSERQKNSLSFLLDKFRHFYVPHIFPDFDRTRSFYRPVVQAGPRLRKLSPSVGDSSADSMLLCRVVVIKWVVQFAHTSYSPAFAVGDGAAGQNASEGDCVRSVLFGSRENVDFVLEVFRQTFLLDSSQSVTIQRVIAVYKDWVSATSFPWPAFSKEASLDGPSSDSVDWIACEVGQTYLSTCGCVQNTFIADAANVFLLEIPSERSTLLDQQVALCKSVLSIYRYMVMNVKLTSDTWQQLLLMLLRITRLVLSKTPPVRREDTLGGRLAQAIFQTLIVTWIRANLNVVVSSELWDKFVETLSSLTLWDELVREWAKTMETLTRVLARQLYRLDLHDLPLERLSEREVKKSKGRAVDQMTKSGSKCGAENKVNLFEQVTTNRRESFVHRSSSGQTGEGHNFRPQFNTINRRSLSHGDMRTLSDLEPPQVRALERNASGKPTNVWRRCSSADSLVPAFSHSHVGSSAGSRSSGLESAFTRDQDCIDRLHSSSPGASESRSVLSGGTVKGWLPDVAAVLWKRMLGALGDVNLITHPGTHLQVFRHLMELFEILVKIRHNQGVSTNNLSTPPPPEWVPPLLLLAPWCFGAQVLPETHLRGRLYALRLLCLLTCRPHEIAMPKNHLVHFYTILHQGLTGRRIDVMSTLIKFIGPRFFSLMLPGYTAFISDFLYAAHRILSSVELKGMPRTEAISIVGVLLAFPSVLKGVPVLMPSAEEQSLVVSSDVKDQIVGVLLKSARKEPAGAARCIAISNIGVFVYAELANGGCHPKTRDAIQVLLSALRFNNKSVAQIASDMLLLLADQIGSLIRLHGDVSSKIVEVLSRTLYQMIPQDESTEEDRRHVQSVLLCLGEWCMRMPRSVLTQIKSDGKSLLDHVFSALIFMCDPASSSIPNTDTQRDSESSSGLNNAKLSESRARLSDVTPNENSLSTRLAARSLLSHLLNNLLHFPIGASVANVWSEVSECDDLPGFSESNHMSADTLGQPNIQFFVQGDATLISFVELPSQDPTNKQVRLILRDISGKYAWDFTPLHLSHLQSSSSALTNWTNASKIDSTHDMPQGRQCQNDSSPEQAALRRPEDVLPVEANTAENMDNLDDLLRYIGHTSPECLEACDVPLNSASATSSVSQAEVDVMKAVMEQCRCESHAAEVKAFSGDIRGPPHPLSDRNGKSSVEDQTFLQCRRLFSQLGLADCQSRKSLHLAKKSEKFLRQLKHLDTKRCRETHKIAVIYVGEGQEDRQSILSNAMGSPAFEQFVSGLGWEVDLARHAGFRGGLQQGSQAAGVSAPYFATSFVEIMFHVSTRMPSNSEESLLQKTRHIGNDEVHIVWSEHWRDYRRGILPTEFCDVLIVIYPLRSGLFRIQISRKPEVPYFGPLFNEAVVDGRVLSGLVRATAVNASRAKRSVLTYYQTHAEERFRALESIATEHRERSTFEDFVTRMLSPVELEDLIAEPNAALPSRPASFDAQLPDINGENLEVDNLFPLVSESRSRSSARSEERFLPSTASDSEAAADESSATKRKKLSFKAAASIMSSIKRSSSSREEPDSNN